MMVGDRVRPLIDDSRFRGMVGSVSRIVSGYRGVSVTFDYGEQPDDWKPIPLFAESWVRYMDFNFDPHELEVVSCAS